MSWIKTNFLWMMYRCGWCTKKNQERVLAVRITREGFDTILSKALAGKAEKRVECTPGQKFVCSGIPITLPLEFQRKGEPYS